MLISRGYARSLPDEIPDDNRFVPKLYRAATIVKEIHELLHMEDKRGKDQ